MKQQRPRWIGTSRCTYSYSRMGGWGTVRDGGLAYAYVVDLILGCVLSLRVFKASYRIISKKSCESYEEKIVLDRHRPTDRPDRSLARDASCSVKKRLTTFFTYITQHHESIYLACECLNESSNKYSTNRTTYIDT